MSEAKEEFYYVTKYVLTRGIMKVSSSMVELMRGYLYVKIYELSLRVQVSPKDWHQTESGAQARAQEVIENRIRSIKSELAELEKRIGNHPIGDWE